MATPLNLFKDAPRWRIAVGSAFILTIALILVQPDPERPAPKRATSQPAPQTAPVPPPLGATSQKTPVPSVSSRVTSQKNAPVATKISPTIRPGTSPATMPATPRDMNPAKVKTIKPTGGDSNVEGVTLEVAPEVIPQDEEQNTLKPSG